MDDSEPYKWLGGYWQNIVSANFSDPSWAYTKNPNAPQNLLHILSRTSAMLTLTTSLQTLRLTTRFTDLRTCACMQAMVDNILQAVRAT